MASNFTPPVRIKNALDNKKLNLSTPTPGVDKKWASLIWGIYANNPRITVYTNDPNDTGESNGYGKISANLDLPVFYSLTMLLSKIIDGPNDQKECIQNKGYTFFNRKRSDEPAVISSLWLGKDKEGVVWISVTAKNRPIIKFNFAPSSFHHFVHGDGTPYTAPEISQLFAKGYVRLLEELMSNMAAANYIEPPPRDPPPGTQNGGYNNNNNNNRNSNANSDMDSDIPF